MGTTERVKVVVTQEHIDRARELERGGLYWKPTVCPIARALGIRSVTASGLGTSLVANHTVFLEEKTYTLPTIAMDFVKQFDSGLDVGPFEFFMERR